MFVLHQQELESDNAKALQSLSLPSNTLWQNSKLYEPPILDRRLGHNGHTSTLNILAEKKRLQ